MHSVSPLPLKGFSLNLDIRWCVKLITRPCYLKAKVTTEGHELKPLSTFPLHISFTIKWFYQSFIKVYQSLVKCLHFMGCRTQNSTMLTKSQGHS